MKRSTGISLTVAFCGIVLYIGGRTAENIYSLRLDDLTLFGLQLLFYGSVATLLCALDKRWHTAVFALAAVVLIMYHVLDTNWNDVLNLFGLMFLGIFQ